MPQTLEHPRPQSLALEGVAQGRLWAAAVAGVLAAAAAIGLGGIAVAPVESHEVLVLGTAREMIHRGDYIVPYLEGKPRLTKPPLSYWATLAVTKLSGAGGQVLPWHGRLVSVLGAVGMAAATLGLGTMLFDRWTALLAALLLITTKPYVNFTHEARPDMLYAFWAAAMLAGLVAAWRADDRSLSQRLSAYAAWFCVGAATLTKGPHLPLMMLLGMVVFLVIQKVDWRRALRVVRPVEGLILTAAMTLPWWLAVHKALGGKGLEGTQLSGSLFGVDWKQAVQMYFLYRPVQLVLPWFALLPAVLLLPRQALERRRGALLLACVLAGPMLLMNFAPQQRSWYMLPTLGVMVLLLAAGAVSAVRSLPRQTAQRLAKALVWGHAAVFAGLSAAVMVMHWRDGGDETEAAAALTALAGAALIVWGVGRLSRHEPLVHLTAMPALAVACLLPMLGTATLWGSEGFDTHRMVAAVRTQVGPATPIATVGGKATGFRYALQDQRIGEFRTIADLMAGQRQWPDGRIVVAIRTDDVKKLPQTLRLRWLVRGNDSHKDSLSLLMIERP